jgi:hypothetical protein
MKGYIHGPMWSKSPSTIEPTLEPMEILPMVDVIRNPQNKCLCMFCVSQKLKDFIWIQLGLWNKSMTNIRKFGGHKLMWENGWLGMTRDDFLRHNLLKSKTQERQLVLAQELNTFYLVMGLCSSWCCILFPRCVKLMGFKFHSPKGSKM